MTKSKQPRSPQTPEEVIAWACMVKVSEVESLDLSADQIEALSGWLQSAIFNKSTGDVAKIKTGTFKCEWCGKTFVRQWKTKPFKHCSDRCRVAYHLDKQKRHAAHGHKN